MILNQKQKVSNPFQWRHDIPLPMCLMLCVNTFLKGHGFKLVLYSVRGFTILSVLQCLSPCLSTLSLSSTAATNHYKKNQLFIVASLTRGRSYLSFRVQSPGPLPRVSSIVRAPVRPVLHHCTKQQQHFSKDPRCKTIINRRCRLFFTTYWNSHLPNLPVYII